MAYRDDVSALSPDHIFIFDGDVVDFLGNTTATGVGLSLTAAAITENATNSVRTNSTGDSVDITSVATINEARERKAVGGFVRFDSIQTPPKLIYHEGGSTASFKFAVGMGNNLTFECQNVTDGFIVQVYGPVLSPNRTYHILGVFESDLYGNSIRLYVDGVAYTESNPFPASPNGDLTAGPRGQASIGDPVTPSSALLGGQVLTQNAPVNGDYAFWAFWGDKPEAVLTEQQIRGTLFEKGALPDTIIAETTEAAAQIALDALANTLRPDAPICIRINDLTGSGGTGTLTLDNVTFDPKASVHIQWMGTGTLDIVNTNGANASIGSTPNGGTINFINPAVLTISPLVVNSEVRIYDTSTSLELAGIESSGTSFVTAIQAPSVNVVVFREDYISIFVTALDLSQGDVSLPIDQVFDRQYGNP